MNKFTIAIALVLLAVSGAFAQVSVAGQTYYYKYVETVDTSTGMRSKDLFYGPGWGHKQEAELYLAFTNNACYGSDEKGTYKSYWGFSLGNGSEKILKYQGEQNNMCVFIAYFENSKGDWKERLTLNFSKDYKRMNVIHYDYSQYATGETSTSIPNRVFIYERVDPPKQEEQKAPTQLW